MREILFRAKAINRVEGREYRTNYKNGDWVYGLVTSHYVHPLLPAEMRNENGILGIEVDYKTIGQYTGLTDKNGTRIFEGDVIRDEDGDVMVVKWLTKSAAFVLEPKPYASIYFYGMLSSRIEIIGNIYDDPELMGGEAHG